MKTFVIIYIISQLVTTAFGLAVIESSRPFVESKLRDKGYQKNKNSLYNFNNTTSNILKGFIPFYYLIKALRITFNKGDVSKEVIDEIESKNYVPVEEEKTITADVQVIENNNTDDLVNNIDIVFEKPEKYTARKNDFDLLETYETPIEYITRDSTTEDKLEVSPFINSEKVVEQVVVKSDVTNKDIAKAITDLNLYELSLLKEKITSLENIKKKNKGLKLEKDVA